MKTTDLGFCASSQLKIGAAGSVLGIFRRRREDSDGEDFFSDFLGVGFDGAALELVAGADGDGGRGGDETADEGGVDAVEDFVHGGGLVLHVGDLGVQAIGNNNIN